MSRRRHRRLMAARVLSKAINLYGDQNSTRIGALRQYLGIAAAISRSSPIDWAARPVVQ